MTIPNPMRSMKTVRKRASRDARRIGARILLFYDASIRSYGLLELRTAGIDPSGDLLDQIFGHEWAAGRHPWVDAAVEGFFAPQRKDDVRVLPVADDEDLHLCYVRHVSIDEFGIGFAVFGRGGHVLHALSQEPDQSLHCGGWCLGPEACVNVRRGGRSEIRGIGVQWQSPNEVGGGTVGRGRAGVTVHAAGADFLLVERLHRHVGERGHRVRMGAWNRVVGRSIILWRVPGRRPLRHDGQGVGGGFPPHGTGVGSLPIGFLAGMSSWLSLLLYVYGNFAPACGILSICSNVDQIHCGRVGVFVTMCRPTSPTRPQWIWSTFEQ